MSEAQGMKSVGLKKLNQQAGIALEMLKIMDGLDKIAHGQVQEGLKEWSEVSKDRLNEILTHPGTMRKMGGMIGHGKEFVKFSKILKNNAVLLQTGLESVEFLHGAIQDGGIERHYTKIKSDLLAKNVFDRGLEGYEKPLTHIFMAIREGVGVVRDAQTARQTERDAQEMLAKLNPTLPPTPEGIHSRTHVHREFGGR